MTARQVAIRDVNIAKVPSSAADPRNITLKGVKIPDFVSDPETPKSVSGVPNQEQDINKLKAAYEIAKQLIDVVGKMGSKQDAVDEPEIKEFVFNIGQSFYILPILTGIDHPMLVGTTYARKIPVGSRAWLVCLDQLRTYGWPEKIISKFLEDSAQIVKHDALYDCYETEAGSGKRINFVEKFCTYWPDPSRQRERIKRNTDKVLSAIKAQYAPENPFRPQNYNAVVVGKETPKAPPAPVSFTDPDGKVWPNILRHFIAVKNKIKEISPVPTFGWECVPLKDQPWVPVEYRQEFEAKFGLTPYYYLPPMQWKRYMFTLLEAQQLISGDAIPKESKLNKEFVQLDASGRWSIIAPGKGESHAFRVFDATIEMNNTACPKITDGELSLREWCDFMKDPSQIYPLLHVILNVDVPPESAQFEKPKYYDQFVYLAYYNKEYHERLIADAPLKLFRDLLVKQYGGEHQVGDGYSVCFKRFLDNIWAGIERSGLLPRGPDGKTIATKLPDQWRNFLETLYTMGKERKCYDPNMPLTAINITLGIPSTKALTRDQISNLSAEQRKIMARSNSLSTLVIPSIKSKI